MAYLLPKILLFVCYVYIAYSQVNPDPSWSDYKLKQCCPSAFNAFGNYCIKCNDKQYWDGSVGKCSQCPDDQIYNPDLKKCECTIACDAPRTYNPSTKQCECPPDQKGKKRVWSDDDKQCQCPPELPLWNGKYCVICPSNTTYDPKEHQCYHCPEGFLRDPQSHNCVPSL